MHVSYIGHIKNLLYKKVNKFDTLIKKVKKKLKKGRKKCKKYFIRKKTGKIGLNKNKMLDYDYAEKTKKKKKHSKEEKVDKILGIHKAKPVRK
jgi:hypothetical protein